MLIVNDFLASALSAIGLPMSEEPMLADCSGSYLTWSKRRERFVYASGKPSLRTMTVRLQLFALVEDNPDVLEKDIAMQLMLNGCTVRYDGSQWVDTIDRQQVVWEVSLPTEDVS